MLKRTGLLIDKRKTSLKLSVETEVNSSAGLVSGTIRAYKLNPVSSGLIIHPKELIKKVVC